MYKFEREIGLDVDKSFLKVSQSLKEKGYVVLSYVDVKEIIKNKFDEDFPGYYILEVCKPAAARELISSNSDYGLFLPCKIVIEGTDSGSRIKMLLVSEMAGTHLKEDMSRPRSYEMELEEVLKGL